MIFTKDYGATTDMPKMANPSIMTAGIVVIIASFDMKFLIYTWY
ncbi:MAG: hypothetical protein ACE5DT_04935 [Nitrosopumilus sp.]